MLIDRVRRIVSLTGDEILEDGLDFDVVDLRDGTVTVKLLVSPSACADCIVPDETLSRILLTQIQKKFPVIHTVDMAPRETADGAAH